jgi:hypothetical protein
LASGLSGVGAVEAEAPVPTVTVQATRDGSFALNTPACANTSSTSLAPGTVEVRRAGPLVRDLTLHYGVTADNVNDYEPLSGVVTIPAGSPATLVVITPRYETQPAPVSIHRDSPVSVRIFDDAAYNLNGGSTATVTLRFDVDVDVCPTAPTGGPSAPAEPEPVSAVRPAVATAPAATPAAAAPSATLPFTGSPVTNVLAGAGTALIAAGSAGLRYGRPRARRMQARRRRARR